MKLNINLSIPEQPQNGPIYDEMSSILCTKDSSRIIEHFSWHKLSLSDFHFPRVIKTPILNRMINKLYIQNRTSRLDLHCFTAHRRFIDKSFIC